VESNNLTNRTYTTPTCSLVVADRRQSIADDTVDFQLHLDRPSSGTTDRATLQGSYRQLDYLQQMVAKYIAELVAKFPLASAKAPTPPPSSPAPASDPAPARIDTDIDSPRSGIIKNLPGLRQNSQPTAPTGDGVVGENQAKSSVSKFLGRWQKHSEPSTPADLPIGGAASPSENPIETAEDPYLIGMGDRALDHQLHLGKIETTSTDKVLTLSAIELFDLATVLDEYANDRGDVAIPKGANNPRVPNPLYGNRATAVGGSATSAQPNLPNLPRIPVGSELDRAYYRRLCRRFRGRLLPQLQLASRCYCSIANPIHSKN
jgi:hypothetical protein